MKKLSVKLLLVALSVMLVFSSCQSGKGDLSIHRIIVNNQGFISVEIKNKGFENIPDDKGNLKMWVNDYLMYEVELKDLDNHAYAQESWQDAFGENSTIIETGVRISGENRILIRVDTDKEIFETNEYQNEQCIKLKTSALSGPDFFIKEVSFLNQTVNVEIGNKGVFSSTENTPIEFKIFDDENSFTQQLNIPPLRLANTTVLTLNPSFAVNPNGVYTIFFKTTNPIAETNHTNNWRTARLKADSVITDYVILLQNQRLREALVWQNNERFDDFNNWGNERIGELFNEIRKIEEGNVAGISFFPDFDRHSYITENEAWELYKVNVAHSLWLEVNRKVPWRLLDYNDSNLRRLLDSRSLFKYRASDNKYHPWRLGSRLLLNQGEAYLFAKNMEMIKNNHENTVLQITKWIRGHLSHGLRLTEADNIEIFGVPKSLVINAIYPPKDYPHHGAGCRGTSGFLNNFLRNLNIPAQFRSVAVELEETEVSGHGSFYLPTLEWSMTHADNFTGRTTDSYYNDFNSKKLFITSESLAQQVYLNPELLCKNDSCLTLGAQASLNSLRIELRAIAEYGNGYFMYKIAEDGEENLDKILELGNPEKHETSPFFEPIIDEQERAEIIRKTKDRLEELGDGDIELGKQKIKHLYKVFNTSITILVKIE